MSFKESLKRLFSKNSNTSAYTVDAQKFQQIRGEQIAPDAIDESKFKPATRNKFLQDWGMPTFIQAYKSAQQTINASIWTKVIFDGEVVDSYSEFANSKFTATEAGRYTVSTAIKWDSVSDSQRYALAIYINGVSYSEIFDMVSTNKFVSNNVALTSSGSVNAKLKTGDYVEVYAWSSGSAKVAQGIKNAYIHITRVR